MKPTSIALGMSLLASVAFGVPTASANTVVLTPLVPNGLDEKKVNNLFNLMSSELEFMSAVDGLEEASPRPASLNTDCISNQACLSGIATTHGGTAVLTGVVTDQGGNLILDLVFFADGRIQRRKAFTVANDATAIANEMTGILNQVIEGAPTANQQAAAAPAADTFDAALGGEDDFFVGSPAPVPVPAPAPAGGGFDGLVDAGPTPEELAYQQQQEAQRRAAEEAARRQAQEDARRRAEEEARRRAEEEARRRAEEEARRRAEEEARRRAEEEARRRAEEEARRQQEEAARRAQEEAARRAQEEAARRAQEEAARQAQEAAARQAQEEAARRAQEEEARRQAAAAAMTAAPAPDPGTINFANSADQISVEDINSAIQFGAPAGGGAPAPQPQPNQYTNTTYTPPAPQPAYQPPATNTYQPANTYTPPAPQPAYQPQPQPQPAYGQPQPQPGYGQQQYGTPQPSSGTSDDLALEEQELQQMGTDGILDLDDPKSKKNKRQKKTGSNATIERTVPNTMQFTLRAGYSRYFSFNFITAGAEVGVPFGKSGVMALAGFESYSVQRELPPAAQTPGAPILEWNTIFPMNIGLVYRIKTGTIVTPYVGADGIFVQYYKDEVGADWAGGARVRGGADFMFSDNFGLNANIAVGGWTGKNWTLIEPTVGNAGLLPQFNAGTVIAF